MAITTDDSQQTTKTIYATGTDGNKAAIASASCHIRPGKSVMINVDVNDADALEAAGVADVQTAMRQYIADELAKAAGLGLPVPADLAESDVSTE